MTTPANIDNIHDSDAEKAVLGSIMLEPSLIPIVKKTLTTFDFTGRLNKSIFNAMMDMDEKKITSLPRSG